DGLAHGDVGGRVGPGVPGLAPCRDQAGEDVVAHVGHVGRDELAGEDLVGVGVPVLLLRGGQRLIGVVAGDVLGAEELGVGGVGVEDHALVELLAAGRAEVVGLDLELGVLLGGVEGAQVEVGVLDGGPVGRACGGRAAGMGIATAAVLCHGGRGEE